MVAFFQMRLPYWFKTRCQFPTPSLQMMMALMIYGASPTLAITPTLKLWFSIGGVSKFLKLLAIRKINDGMAHTMAFVYLQELITML